MNIRKLLKRFKSSKKTTVGDRILLQQIKNIQRQSESETEQLFEKNNEITTKEKNHWKKIRELELYFNYLLSKDPQDGTNFDCQILQIFRMLYPIITGHDKRGIKEIIFKHMKINREEFETLFQSRGFIGLEKDLPISDRIVRIIFPEHGKVCIDDLFGE